MTSDRSGPPPGCPAHASRTPLYGPDFTADPTRVYAELRRHGSIAPVEIAPGTPAMLVIGYHTALEVLREPARFPRDPRRWQARVPADCPVLPMMGYRPNALFTDGAVHARVRGAATSALARIDLNNLRSYVEQSADMLIDRFGPAGKADLISEYARILPLMVFNLLFGCPPDLGDRLVEGMSGIFELVEPEKANELLTRTLFDLVALKRAQPGPDMTSWLMEHPADLTDEEMVHQLVTLQAGGTEPEMNLIGNGMRLLLSDDRFAHALSGGSLAIEDAIDEILWTDPPIANYATHYPLSDISLAGTHLPEGEPVVISFTGANTDPSLPFERTGNRAHLAWGAGPHTCPAQMQARLIASVAIEKLLDRLPDMRLAVPVERLTWRPGFFHRGLTALPVEFVPLPAPAPALAEHREVTPPPSWPAETPLPRASSRSRSQHWRSTLMGWWRGQ
ncbi:cytochrome P450 [Actinoallomurus iriomotensis]|uniref:Cytochrome P450 n=1 Tax=Actinoallomurus iriomotensis TaxID=478107 RepID=A0A9W6W262_9ACTN|nr:cytochrome P450 [Actinoallomurus iriomotensis]GLY88119.1 cytochrome P450 [Actinoallomurus iriomotensis]